MRSNGSAFSTLLGGMLLSAIFVLSAGAQVPVRTQFPAPAKPAPRPRQEPCWQVAGVTQAAIREQRSIALQAKSEVESVCANSSLSVQQKRQEIKQIHERERQQIDAIISPSQREALRSCQESRGHGGHGGGGGHGGSGPCGGELSSGHNPHPMHEQEEENEVPAKDAPKPN